MGPVDSGPTDIPPIDASVTGECRQANDCKSLVETALQTFISPTYPRDYSEAGCIRARLEVGGSSRGGADGEPSCICGPNGYALLSSTAPYACLFHGRLGLCLYQTEEFPGCDLDAADSCNAVCADLEARVDQDAARTIAGNVRFTRCNMTTCEAVFEVQGTCYAMSSLWPVGESCAKTNQEILAAEAERQGDGAPPSL